MKRTIGWTLAMLVASSSGIGPVVAGPFGGAFRGIAKNRAKREAKERAKEKAKEVVMEATGLDPNLASMIEGDGTGSLQENAVGSLKENAVGSLKATLISEAQQMVGGDLSPYVGKSSAEVKAMLEERVYGEQGISRFSSRGDRIRADAMVKKQLGPLLQGLEALPAGGVLSQTAEAAMEGQDIGEAASEAAMSEAGGVAEEVMEPVAPEMDVSAYVGKGERDIRAMLQEEVYKDKGITRFTPRSQRITADAWVEKKYKEVLAAMDAAGK